MSVASISTTTSFEIIMYARQIISKYSHVNWAKILTVSATHTNYFYIYLFLNARSLMPHDMSKMMTDGSV